MSGCFFSETRCSTSSLFLFHWPVVMELLHINLVIQMGTCNKLRVQDILQADAISVFAVL